MIGRSLFLVGFWLLSFFAQARPAEELLQNLRGRIQPLPQGGSLIKSFTTHSQSYIYDQALAIIAFSKSGDRENARNLLRGLEKLQLPDGSLYFSYYMDGKSPYPIEGDKRYSGAIAWVAMAAVHFQHQFKSKEFYSFNKKVLTYLESQMKPLKIRGQETEALKFSPTDIASTDWREDETTALEHNLDAYAAFYHFNQLNHHKRWKQKSQKLKNFILTMWDSSRSHFWSGANLKTGMINDHELYLDNQTWSLLALDPEDLKSINPKLALDLNCEVFLVEHEGITGFMDSRPVRRPASSKFVWSEGTAGQILAMNRQEHTCNEWNSRKFLSSISQMVKEDGGIAYATTTPNPDFTTASSVAGTAWLYFAQKDINPFKLN